MIYLDDLLVATDGQLLVPGARVSFPGFALDSRQVAPGECFVAARGPHADGHDYLEDAVAHGAGGVLIEQRRLPAIEATAPGLRARLEDAGAVVVAVADTRLALRRYAAHVLRAWGPTVIAVTGSTGKTTTKEAIADVLDRAQPTFRSWRNYNDLLGLPVSLGGLEPSHRYAVLEMACDHPGEIQALCEIAAPTVGVVTNVSPTQLQYFGSVSALAAELNQLPRALPPSGYAVLNADDPAARSMGSDTGASVRFFGPVASNTLPDELDPRHTMRYALVPLGTGPAPALTLRPLAAAPAQPEESPMTFQHLHGDHWACAVLAALTVGEAVGVSCDEALRALADLRPLPGRLNWLEGRDGLTLLDDSHNAAPASMLAGLDVLAALGRFRGVSSPRIAVLGDMLRLGDKAEAANRLVGRRAAETATHVVSMGPRAEVIADEALRVGMPRDRVAITRTPDDAAQAVLGFARSAARNEGIQRRGESGSSGQTGPLVLIKGSEEMRMERVTALLLDHPERAEHMLDRQMQAWKRVVMMRPDRPTWLEVDLGVIRQNTRLVKEAVGPGVEVLVSLKADAYGHGALPVARTVLRNGARWLGVATVSEAEPLRAASISAPILIFGFTAPWQAREAVRLDLRATVYGAEVAHALSRAAQDLGRPVRVHVKIDTGMGRLGLWAEDVPGILAFFEEMRNLPDLVVEGVFTHLATADSADQTYALQQLARFEAVLAALEAGGLRPPLVHAANSAALFTLPQARYNLVRPGIAIYGLSPSADVRLPAGFRAALAFKTQVAQVKEIPAGEGISYGATYITRVPTRVATLPVGYADGFRRAPANWGEVLVHGQRSPLLGRVCMDQCMIDVTHIPAVRVGDEVVLIGRQGNDELTAEEVATRLGTINYEVVAELLARVPRVS
jgi:Alr-MurF fusion protein